MVCVNAQVVALTTNAVYDFVDSEKSLHRHISTQHAIWSAVGKPRLRCRKGRFSVIQVVKPRGLWGTSSHSRTSFFAVQFLRLYCRMARGEQYIPFFLCRVTAIPMIILAECPS